MIGFVTRHPIALGVAAFALLVTVPNTVRIVKETEQGVVTRFGKPVRIVNRYDAKSDFGSWGAGINFQLPFAENIVWMDKRVRDLDMEKQQVLSTDQRRLEVDAFARFRIVDPLRAYIAARNEDNVEASLRPILGSQLRNELGKRPFASLLSPEREGAMENIRDGLNGVARQYGVEIVDVRIKKADLPDGAPLDSAFERMRTARRQEAQSIRAKGMRDGQIIRAQADAEAAQIYAASFGKDPEFYDFYRAMQSYEKTFAANGQKPTTIIMSPNNSYLKEFSGR
ncbi:protease modulator HflC [Sphingomonas jaspsi]|uniref:protease modulator HflC n=1 Tax=Sphingomonas jaspsi TaxID=392409 RepID=UPI0004B607F1|nr:protease modulator HflC [Sphingomonas jaspsi]